MMEKSLIDNFNENYKVIKEKVATAAEKSGRDAKDIIILAATKTVDVELINYAISNGIDHIGENRVQEFLSKYNLYADVHKHFIGHLQTNKVKDIIGKVELIHSVDSIRLANEISKKALQCGICAEILLEVNIGKEQSKSGFMAEELSEAVYQIAEFNGIKIKGLMAIPPVCDNQTENRRYFEQMNKLFIDIGAKKIDNSSMDILSMGMSEDYACAVEQGANLIRIGTALFGRRNYNI